jgi:hypothetical protein
MYLCTIVSGYRSPWAANHLIPLETRRNKANPATAGCRIRRTHAEKINIQRLQSPDPVIQAVSSIKGWSTIQITFLVEAYLKNSLHPLAKIIDLEFRIACKIPTFIHFWLNMGAITPSHTIICLHLSWYSFEMQTLWNIYNTYTSIAWRWTRWAHLNIMGWIK